jgi:transaldolase
VDRLQALYEEQGQSPWLDNLRRGYLTSGQLADFVTKGIRGLTSNPTIFQKAMEGSDEYDDQLADLVKAGGNVVDHYWSMALRDIRGALEVFAPLYEASGGTDGFVSVEVAPDLAHDTEGTLASAKRLHDTVNKPNLLVKIPATAEGVPAIRDVIASGKSVNVTLIFSLERYNDVMEAYLQGLEACEGDLSAINSVGSFFISRVDTEVDRRLEEIGTDEALALRGTAALAQGKLAYQEFQRAFSGDRWDALAKRGAKVQRPLWASTSTKNPAYPKTLYVDNLIGPSTVNTMPDSTIADFVDHGTVARTVDKDVDAARQTWKALAEVGVDMDDVGKVLEQEGVASFQKSFDELLGALNTKSAELRANDPN